MAARSCNPPPSSASMMLTPSITRTRGALMRMQSMLTKMTWLMNRKKPSSTCAASRIEPDLAAPMVSHLVRVGVGVRVRVGVGVRVRVRVGARLARPHL